MGGVSETCRSDLARRRRLRPLMGVMVCTIPNLAVRQLPIQPTEIGDLGLGVKLGQRLGRLTKEQLWTWCWTLAMSRRSAILLRGFFIMRIVERRLTQRRKYVPIRPLSDLDQVELDA
jgi:hypothetical protein